MNRRIRLLATIVILAAPLTAIGLTTAAGDDKPVTPVTDQRTLLIQLAVADLDRSVAFYRDVMGLEIESVNDGLKWARVKTGVPGITIGLGETDEPKGSGTVSLNFGVKNIDKARATLEARGVVFKGPTIKIPGVVMLADLEDPDGNTIRLAGHP